MPYREDVAHVAARSPCPYDMRHDVAHIQPLALLPADEG